MTHFTPAQPGDTPGQVEPDDSRPQPIDAADPLDEAMIAAANAVDAYVEANPGPHPPPTALIIGLSVRAAAPIIAAQIQAERDELKIAKADMLAALNRLGDEVDLSEAISYMDVAECAVHAVRWHRAQAAECTCQSWPPEGPDPSCAVHGAIRALNEAKAENADLRARLATAERDTAEWRGVAEIHSEHCAVLLAALEQAKEAGGE